MPNESHTTHVDSRRQSDNPGHLDRASAKTRPAVNETRSRCRRAGDVALASEVARVIRIWEQNRRRSRGGGGGRCTA
jgi:hypothetical protein